MFKCLVCDNTVEQTQLQHKTVPLFEYASGKKIEGFDYTLDCCSSCLEELGEPVKILHRPYELDLAIFMKSSVPVTLQGSYPQD